MTLSNLMEILEALNRAEVRYVVVGGVAVNAHGYLRLTQDLDLVLDLEDESLLRALEVLEDLGYRPVLPVALSAFADPVQRREWVEERNMQVFSLVSDRFRDTTVDIFAASPFDFETEHDHAMRAEVGEGVLATFVRIETLIQMKEEAGRPRDLDDVQHLRWIERAQNGGEDE